MVTIDKILEEFETKFDKISKDKAMCVLNDEELLDITSELFLCFLNPISNLFYLKYYAYDKDFKTKLFKLLDENNYNTNYEIMDLIKDADLFLKEKDYKDEIEKYSNSPYIDRINLTTDTLEIESTSLGNYEIVFADKYFKKDNKVFKYINTEPLNGGCHRHVEFLVKREPNFYSITSLCNRRFEDLTYYHSYCYDEKTNRVIDLCSNLVMDKDEYDKLFKTEEIFKIKGKDLGKAYFLAGSNNYYLFKKYKGIAATLFQQFIWENNFSSPNKLIYSEEPINKKILMKNRKAIK